LLATWVRLRLPFGFGVRKQQRQNLFLPPTPLSASSRFSSPFIAEHLLKNLSSRLFHISGFCREGWILMNSPSKLSCSAITFRQIISPWRRFSSPRTSLPSSSLLRAPRLRNQSESESLQLLRLPFVLFFFSLNCLIPFARFRCSFGQSRNAILISARCPRPMRFSEANKERFSVLCSSFLLENLLNFSCCARRFRALF
jgi:hypothetical protein